MVSFLGKSDGAYELVSQRVDPIGRRHERIALEEAAFTNYAYYRGKTNFDLINWRFRDRLPNGPRHRVPYEVNMIRVDTIRAVAQLLGLDIGFRAIPSGDDFVHQEVAFMSEKFFEHIRDVTGFNRIKLISTLSAAIYGTGIVRMLWNRNAGEPTRFYSTNSQAPEYMPEHVLSTQEKRDLERKGFFKDVAPGGLDCSNTSLFSFYQDWASRDAGILGCKWAAEKHLVDVATAAELLNVDEKDIPITTDDRGGRFYEEAVAYMSSNRFTTRTWSEPNDKVGRRTLWVDMWDRPTRKQKKGRRVINVGGKTFYDGDNPNIADKTGLTHLPWIIQYWNRNPGDFWGSGLVEDQRNSQWHLNEARTCLASLLRTGGNPIMLIGKGSGINPDKVPIHPGAVLACNENTFGIKHGPPPTLPPEIAGFGAICEQDLSKIASQSDIEGSSMPGQLRSGPAVRAMNAERHIALNIPAQELVAMVRDFGRMSLIYHQMNADKPLLARYLGEDGEYVSKWFDAANLSNDLVVTGEPNVVDTAESRKSDLYDEVQLGILNPAINPDDRRIAFKQLRYNTKNEASSRALQAARSQQIEIEQMMEDPRKYIQGIGPDGAIVGGFPVRPFEDHEAEMSELVSFMYGQRFRNSAPETRALIEDHYQKHAAELDKLQAKQMQMAAAMKGTPGAKGEASQAKV